MYLPAAPAVDDHQKACFFDSALFAAEPTTARRQCFGVVVFLEKFISEKFLLIVSNRTQSIYLFSLPVTGRSEKAGLTGTVDSTWLPVVGQKVGSGHRCLVHTSVMILEPAEWTSTKSN